MANIKHLNIFLFLSFLCMSVSAFAQVQKDTAIIRKQYEVADPTRYEAYYDIKTGMYYVYPKIGNTIIYFSQHIDQLSKTKLLKLLYILDEISISRSGIPVLNLKFKAWKFGPVSEDLFIELSSELSFLKDFLVKSVEGDHSDLRCGDNCEAAKRRV